MSASWQRWLSYAKAKLDATLKESEADLDDREARLQAEAEGKPWLSSTSEAPTFDEMRARIEHDAREAAERQRRQPPGDSPPPSPSSQSPPRPGPYREGGASDPAPPAGRAASAEGISNAGGEDLLASFDMAAHQKAADERLAAIRRELGLADADEGETADTRPPVPPTPPSATPPSATPPDDGPSDDPETPIAPV